MSLAFYIPNERRLLTYKNRQDLLPPWNPQSQWFILRQALEDFRTSLPRHHLLTPQNTSAHINIRTSTPYTLVHITASLCHMLLYREFLPFIPFRHGRPQGPLDGSSGSSVNNASNPLGFWEESARECFGAARDTIDLVRTCHEWGVAVETPIIGFAVYNVATLGVYLINFPWMDVNGYLRRVNPTREDHIPEGAEAARKALEMVGPMRSRLHMAHGWVKTIKRTHKHFSRLRKSWFDSAPRIMQGREREVWNDQSIATAQLHPPDAESTRVLLEKVLRDMEDGEEDGEDETTDSLQSNGASMPSGFDMASPRVKHESSNDKSHAQQEERWNAINSVAAAASALTSVAAGGGQPTSATAGGPVQPAQQANSAHFRFYSSYGPSSSSSPSTPSNHAQQSFRSSVNDGASPNHIQQQGKSPHPQTPSMAHTTPTWTSANGTSNSATREREREILPGIRGFAASPRRGSEAATSGAVAAGFATPGQSYSAAMMQQRRTSDKEIRDPDTWLLGLEKTFGGDDLAAFVDGIEVGEAARGLVRVGSGGWLGAVWGLS